MSGLPESIPAARLSGHRERGVFRAICAGEGFAVRATGIVGNIKTEIWKTPVRSPAISFQSAPTPSAASVGGLLALLPWQVLDAFKFPFPLRIQPRKQSRSGLSKCLYLSCSLLHDRNMAWRSKQHVHRKSASGAQSNE